MALIAPPPPVVIASPVSFGSLAVRIGPRTTGVIVQANGRITARREVLPGPRRVAVPVPTGAIRVRVGASGSGRTRWSRLVRLRVLPPSSRRAGRLPGRLDTRLQADLERLAAGMPAISGAYVQHLGSGCGAAVDAAAQFPAASTLKAAILVEAIRRWRGRPSDRQRRLLDDMTINSHDRAANEVLLEIGDGSAEAGGARVTATLARLGLRRSLVRRGYILENAGRPIPLEAGRRPALYTNFVTTPFELSALMVAIHRGALGRGGVARLGIDAATARRELMVRLLSVRDTSKIVAGLPAGTPVAHKTGYTEQVKHDAGVVYLRRGPIVVTAMTWSAGGVSDARGNRFAADVARAAVVRLAAGGRC